MKILRLLFWLIHSETYPTEEKNIQKTFFLIYLIILPIFICPFDHIIRLLFPPFYAEYNILIVLLLFLFVSFLYKRLEKRIIELFIVNKYFKQFIHWKYLNNAIKFIVFMICFFTSFLICRIMYLITEYIINNYW